jgi:hypothetical protein
MASAIRSIVGAASRSDPTASIARSIRPAATEAGARACDEGVDAGGVEEADGVVIGDGASIGTAAMAAHAGEREG